MSAAPPEPTTPAALRARIAEYDWAALRADVDRYGHARLPALLDAPTCAAISALYDDAARFRSFVDLGRHRFGDHGDYRYFGYPLPRLIETLRVHLYARLAPLANAWARALGAGEAYPPGLRGFLARCREAGQTRPTPLLLRYDTDGYNCLHQDLYGEVAFPLQVAVLLSRPGEDFRGGEFLLTEQRPRMQSRGEAISLAQGEGVVFPNRVRTQRGARGHYAVQVRHGVSRVHAGERRTLGIIFHDAR
jgi:hypothetical protein